MKSITESLLEHPLPFTPKLGEVENERRSQPYLAFLKRYSDRFRVRDVRNTNTGGEVEHIGDDCHI
jgi:hypothetical protein